MFQPEYSFLFSFLIAFSAKYYEEKIFNNECTIQSRYNKHSLLLEPDFFFNILLFFRKQELMIRSPVLLVWLFFRAYILRIFRSELPDVTVVFHNEIFSLLKNNSSCNNEDT